MRKYLFILIAALVILSIINHRSIGKAVELCEEGKGTPQIEKDVFAFNWSVSCQK
ncbi:hypothetical protein [Cytobacillus sp. NCCP-133]|uniref:hypothetical protein n=1 Tax=Cytobacillus sp. NCCP-133 TaxID=766848 RepID=UPI00222FF586|nr:hypothetical protein [Cytobacillus sp. NCCP-133]GLB61948.1 hypothetical protein NCCP133_40770 [Cytobacillus sp. NCCP-133]